MLTLNNERTMKRGVRESVEQRKLFRTFRQTLSEDSGFQECQRVVVGLSGGVDSVVLLHLLSAVRDQGGPEVVAAHVHHALRGEEADRDAKLAEEVAHLHRCEFHVLHLPKSRLESPAEHILREGRLKRLEALASSLGAGRVALGHHLDDQAETVFFRLMGGADLRGLAGIRVFRPPVWIRPMLRISQEEIVEEAKRCRLSFVVDSTNQLTEARRNYLRHEVFPTLKREFNPRLSDHLVSLSESISGLYDFMEGEAISLLAEARHSQGGWKVSNLASAPHVLRGVALGTAFRQVVGEGAALRRPQVDALHHLILTPGKTRTYSLPRQVLAVRDRDRFELRRID